MDKQEILAKARQNEALMDGTTDAAQRIIESTHLVFGVWQDESLPDGIGVFIIRGERSLEAMGLRVRRIPSGHALPEFSLKIRWDAILFDSFEAAALYWFVWGDGAKEDPDFLRWLRDIASAQEAAPKTERSSSWIH
jgi:hypothetical protein